MAIFRFILISALFFAGIGFLKKISPNKSRLTIIREEIHFPEVSGFNLNRQEFVFPQDFEGDFNLVIIPFQQYQQTIVNTWIPFLQEIEFSHPGFVYYELPTINKMPAISRTFINEGMRAGIPDKTARERTITLYLDKEIFKSAINIYNENDIHLFLVDQNGNILWRNTGEYTKTKVEDLIKAINTQMDLENI